jgi:hypothetical protein
MRLDHVQSGQPFGVAGDLRQPRLDEEPVAVLHQNALFAGHDDGAENWAILASLIETCKLHRIDAQAYLADVITRLVNLWPNDRLDELLPWTWAAARKPKQLAA